MDHRVSKQMMMTGECLFFSTSRDISSITNQTRAKLSLACRLTNNSISHHAHPTRLPQHETIG
jgi:hypothetical protein